MNKDKKVLYLISSIILAVLLSALFINVGSSKIVAACLLLPLAVITRTAIRKRASYSINKKEVFLLSTIIGVIYVVLVQLSGLYFGFYKNPYFVNSKLLLTAIIPLTIIIITTEIIRSTLLDQKNTFISVLAFLSCVIAEVLTFSNLTGITTVNSFMDLVGLTLFPAITANILYHYSSRRFGVLPNIVLRMIITLYIYFIPTVTAMSDALMVCTKIFLPIIILFLYSALYEKKKKNAIRKGHKLAWIANMLTFAFIISIAMLISCQFRFGAIVIATESMTGEINKGDVIIYERYDDQSIKEGQVIVFEDQQNRIVHRVVKIEQIRGETRYYTKGDTNDSLDTGFRTRSDIVGLTDVKLAYLGYPTLFLHDLLQRADT